MWLGFELYFFIIGDKGYVFYNCCLFIVRLKFCFILFGLVLFLFFFRLLGVEVGGEIYIGYGSFKYFIGRLVL